MLPTESNGCCANTTNTKTTTITPAIICANVETSLYIQVLEVEVCVESTTICRYVA